VADDYLLFFFPSAFNFDTFDGAKPRFLNRGKKRRSVSTLSIPQASDRGVEWVDFFHFFLTFLQWYSYVNLQVDSDLAIKKPAKKSFRVLAGISYKPKRLCATFFI